MREIPPPVVHYAVPEDPGCQEPGNPPREPFEAAGFEVRELAWDSRGVKRSRFPMTLPDCDNERLQAFRKRYDFISYMNEGSGEFERLLRLRNWVHRQWKHSMPVKYTDDVFEILDLAATGGRFYCSMFARIYQACLLASGYLGRHVGNVSNYTPAEGAATHGQTDVFVQELGKWVLLDANFDFHYERDGVPLNPWEVGEEAFRNNGRDVRLVAGLERKIADKMLTPIGGKHETWRALWNHHRWNHDPFTRHGSWFGKFNSQLVLVRTGPRHEGAICYRGKAPESEVDSAYFDGRMVFTTRDADVYPDVGTSHLALEKSACPGAVKVRVGTYTPNFDALLVKVNDDPERPAGLEFDWYLWEGSNTLRVRTRNKFGVQGRESSVRAVVKKKPG